MQAQSDGETEAPPASEVLVDESETVADAGGQAPQESEPGIPSEQEGNVLGAETSTEVASSSDVGQDPISAGDQCTTPAASTELASTTAPDFLVLDTASSTASSTEPVADPPAGPIEDPFVLQPAVTLHVTGTSIAADIELENLTCKACEKVLPVAQVRAYYTAWYPNDGPDLKEVREHYAEQEINVSV